jgi:hypothetical protein
MKLIRTFRKYDVLRTHEICAVLGYCSASSGNRLPTFRDNVSVPSSRSKKSRRKKPLKMGPIRCSETSVKECHSTLRYAPEERRSHQQCIVSLKSLISRVASNYGKILTDTSSIAVQSLGILFVFTAF